MDGGSQLVLSTGVGAPEAYVRAAGLAAGLQGAPQLAAPRAWLWMVLRKLVGPQEEPSFAEGSCGDYFMTGPWPWRAFALTCSLDMAREQFEKASGGCLCLKEGFGAPPPLWYQLTVARLDNL